MNSKKRFRQKHFLFKYCKRNTLQLKFPPNHVYIEIHLLMNKKSKKETIIKPMVNIINPRKHLTTSNNYGIKNSVSFQKLLETDKL